MTRPVSVLERLKCFDGQFLKISHREYSRSLISEYPGYSLISEPIKAREKHYSLVGYMLTVDIYFLWFNQNARKVLSTCLANTKLLYYLLMIKRLICIHSVHWDCTPHSPDLSTLCGSRKRWAEAAQSYVFVYQFRPDSLGLPLLIHPATLRRVMPLIQLQPLVTSTSHRRRLRLIARDNSMNSAQLVGKSAEATFVLRLYVA